MLLLGVLLFGGSLLAAVLLGLTPALAPLGGGWWPLAYVPGWMQTIGHLSPVAWFLDAANARLLYENNHDALTRLPNRSFFQQRLGELWTALERDGAGLAVMFLDLDRFKRINDQFGHPFGDLLLVAAGERLSGCLRETNSGQIRSEQSPCIPARLECHPPLQ